MQKKQTKVVEYRLFAAGVNARTLQIAMETPFARIRNGYILLYKQGEAPDGYKELTPEIMEILTKDEREWLQEVNLAIMQDFLKAHQEEARKGMIAFGKKFEKELKAELERGTEAGTHAQQDAAGGA